MEMEKIIGLKELRNNTDKYVKEINKGNSFIVMRKSRPLFKISFPERDVWETVIDFTKTSKKSIPARNLLKYL